MNGAHQARRIVMSHGAPLPVQTQSPNAPSQLHSSPLPTRGALFFSATQEEHLGST